jgi:hypothetical protein
MESKSENGDTEKRQEKQRKETEGAGLSSLRFTLSFMVGEPGAKHSHDI